MFHCLTCGGTRHLIISFQMPQLEKKLETDLSDDSKVVACRFPFPTWKASDVIGEGIDSVWVYKPSVKSKT